MTNLLADNAILILPDDDILIELEHLEVVHRRHHHHRPHHNITVRSIAIPDLREGSITQMSLDVRLEAKQGAVIGFVAEKADGSPVDPQPSFTFTNNDPTVLDMTDTDKDGNALPSNTKFFRPTSAVSADTGASVVVSDDHATLACNFTLAAAGEDHIAGNVTLVDLP